MGPDLSRSGSRDGFQALSAVYLVGDPVFYSAVDVDGSGNPIGDWETGLGTFTAGFLSRDSVLGSSNNNGW